MQPPIKKEASVPVQAPPRDNYSELDRSINLADTLMSQFNQQKAIDVPPRADLRTFNVNDILGDLDRDNRGNVVVAN